MRFHLLRRRISKRLPRAPRWSNLPFQGPNWLEFKHTGSKGSADISADISNGNLGDLVTAINAQTSFTGISAATNADGALELTENFNGEIKITDVEIDGGLCRGEVEYFANLRAMTGLVKLSEKFGSSLIPIK